MKLKILHCTRRRWWWLATNFHLVILLFFSSSLSTIYAQQHLLNSTSSFLYRGLYCRAAIPHNLNVYLPNAFIKELAIIANSSSASSTSSININSSIAYSLAFDRHLLMHLSDIEMFRSAFPDQVEQLQRYYCALTLLKYNSVSKGKKTEYPYLSSFLP